MKKLITLTSLAAWICMTLTLGFAEDRLTRLHVYQNACTKSCHTSPDNGGELDTTSKTQNDWRILLQNEQARLKAIHKTPLNLDFIAQRHPSLDTAPWDLVEEQLTTYAYDGDQPDDMLIR